MNKKKKKELQVRAEGNPPVLINKTKHMQTVKAAYYDPYLCFVLGCNL